MATAKPGIRVRIDQNKHFCYQGSFLKRVRCAELGEAPKTGALPGAAFPHGCGPAARSVPEIRPERWARISTEFLTGLWKGIQRTRRGRHLAKAHSRHRAPCRPHAPPTSSTRARSLSTRPPPQWLGPAVGHRVCWAAKGVQGLGRLHQGAAAEWWGWAGPEISLGDQEATNGKGAPGHGGRYSHPRTSQTQPDSFSNTEGSSHLIKVASAGVLTKEWSL